MWSDVGIRHVVMGFDWTYRKWNVSIICCWKILLLVSAESKNRDTRKTQRDVCMLWVSLETATSPSFSHVVIQSNTQQESFCETLTLVCH
jgi:hypothetical protein